LIKRRSHIQIIIIIATPTIGTHKLLDHPPSSPAISQQSKDANDEEVGMIGHLAVGEKIKRMRTKRKMKYRPGDVGASAVIFR
jgi:hypothetical protein